MQAAPLQASLKAATEVVIGPVRVLFAGAAKSTWKRHTFRILDPKLTKYGSVPAGGAVVPSISLGKMLPKLLESWKHCCVAAAPALMAAPSRAQIRGPWKVLVKMLKVTKYPVVQTPSLG